MSLEAQLSQKHKSINAGNPVQAVKDFLKVRPVGCRERKLLLQDLDAFQFIMGKIPEKDQDGLVKNLTEDECELLIDYLHRYMQHIGESEVNALGGSLLALENRIVAAHGPSIIINAISRRETIVERIDNYN